MQLFGAVLEGFQCYHIPAERMVFICFPNGCRYDPVKDGTVSRALGFTQELVYQRLFYLDHLKDQGHHPISVSPYRCDLYSSLNQ